MKNEKQPLFISLLIAATLSAGFVSSASATPLDGSWTQVGLMQPDGGMFDGNCNLRLTGCSFNNGGDFWNPFANATEILFITADRQFWGEASYSVVLGLVKAAGNDFNPNLAWIDAGRNGVSVGAVTGNLLMRNRATEDPWVTLIGSHCAHISHTPPCSEVMWGENDVALSTHMSLMMAHGGMEVYVRSAPVPEPASVVLLGLGLAGLGFSRRSKQRAA